MANEKKDKKTEKTEESSQNGYSEEEVRKESSKAAKQATEAQNKATELMQAAAAAGDPDERQKLMEEALEQQIQSKSFGKTAKYLRSGTFQGMAVGAGLGIAPGASLGAITGTLVGGVSSTALGGLGAGLGAATGWMHGPFWDMGKGGGKLIQKVTGNLPGWKATESQKKQLEKMVGQISEQDTPSKEELESLGNEGPSEEQKEVMDNVKSKMPSMPSSASLGGSTKQEDSKRDKKEEETKDDQSKTEETRDSKTGPSQSEAAGTTKGEDATQSGEKETNGNERDGNGTREDRPSSEGQKNADTAQEKLQETGSKNKDTAAQNGGKERKKPRKLQPKSETGGTPSDKPAVTKKQPRKLEKRLA